MGMFYPSLHDLFYSIQMTFWEVGAWVFRWKKPIISIIDTIHFLLCFTNANTVSCNKYFVKKVYILKAIFMHNFMIDPVIKGVFFCQIKCIYYERRGEYSISAKPLLKLLFTPHIFRCVASIEGQCVAR